MIDRHGEAAESLARHFLDDRKHDRELIAALVKRVKELQQQLPTIEQAIAEPIDQFVASFSEVFP